MSSTVQSIGLFTIFFSDPNHVDYVDDSVNALNANISFRYPITRNIQTLDSKDVEQGNGILYVPELSSQGCKDAEREHLPSNVTRLNNLPDTDYALLAFAPWFSPPCILEYFQAARNSPVRAFLTYLPGESDTMPPVMNDAAWNLRDGGSWKVNNTFPTYALSSSAGDIIATQLSLYSGNASDVPYGKELPGAVQSTDYVRLWATIDLETSNRLPSLWVFLVIVLGLLIFVIGTTSVLMHIVQRRRRNSLRQRIINGEVNLETLGVKRVVVPREILEKLPLYLYSPVPEVREKTLPRAPDRAHNLPSPSIDAETGTKTAFFGRHSSAPNVPTLANPTSGNFSQSSCAVCLDDFEPGESQIRELPCHHIFHAECIDTFLLKNSSLCPLCKQTVLPAGYCPTTITNIMVRRERIISRNRARGNVNGQVPAPVPTGNRPGVSQFIRNHVGGNLSGRRIFSAPERFRRQPADIEMANNSASVPAPSSNTHTTSPPEPSTEPVQAQHANVAGCTGAPPSSSHQEDWTRQRALMLLGNRHVPGPAEEEEGNSQSRWKRGLHRLFPGFR